MASAIQSVFEGLEARRKDENALGSRIKFFNPGNPFGFQVHDHGLSFVEGKFKRATGGSIIMIVIVYVLQKIVLLDHLLKHRGDHKIIIETLLFVGSRRTRSVTY